MATTNQAERHHTVLFTVPFHAEMTPHTKRLLEAELNLTMHWERKVASALQAAGVARLDLASGLYLLPGQGDDDWVLECRTFRPPSPDTERRWRAAVDDVVSRIDPSVTVAPARAAEAAPAPRPRRWPLPHRGRARAGRAGATSAAPAGARAEAPAGP